MTTENTKTIYEKLQKIHSKVTYIQKSQSGSQYTYAGSSDVLGQVHGLMDEEHLLLIPRIVDQHTEISTNKKGSQVVFTELQLTMTWVNSDNPEEKIECPWYAQGFDTAGEKGVGKALTYGEKYFLLKFFNIATDNADPDSFQKNVESKKQPDPISKEHQKTLTDLFASMASVTNTDVKKVTSGYLQRAKVNSITKLNDDIAVSLIDKVASQLDKQLEKEGM